MDHMKPETLMKEVRPSELRAWRFKYDQWFRSSFQGSVPLSLEVDTFLCFLDSWWLNRIQPKVRIQAIQRMGIPKTSTR